MATFCQNCGAEIKNGQQYCTNCGKPVPKKAESKPAQQLQPYNYQGYCYANPYYGFPAPIIIPYGGMNPYAPYGMPYGMPCVTPCVTPYPPMVCPYAQPRGNGQDETMCLLDVHGTLPSQQEEEEPAPEEETPVEEAQPVYEAPQEVEELEEVEEKPVKKRNGFSIAGFILSWFGPLAILGLIFSIVGASVSKKKGSGRGLAIAGIIISVIVLLAICGGVAAMFVFADQLVNIPYVGEYLKTAVDWVLGLFK